MTTKKIEILDKDGNTLLPITNAEYVTNAVGDNLKDVEAAAQVNVIESIKYNGTALTPSSKSVALPVFTMSKLSTPQTGYASSYQLMKDGVAVGDTINLAKDQVLQNVELKTCTTKDQPVEGYNVGDKYFDFTFQNKSEHLYLLVTDLVDVYTEGTGISISAQNAITNTGVTAIAESSTNGSISVTTNGSTAQVAVHGLGTAAYQASTAFAPASHNQAANTIDAMTGYAKASEAAAISTSDTLNQAIGKLEKGLDGKQPAGSYAPLVHEHTVSDITDFPEIPDSPEDIGAAPAVHSHDVFSTSKAGFVPQATSGDATKFLRGDGQFAEVSITDTKNTAGATDTSSKIYLVGATAQGANPQTYSHDTAFVDANGRLNSAAPAADAEDTTVATTAWVMGKGFLTSVPAHNQASSTINAMTGYAKASAAADISTSDTLNVAVGKLEYKLDQAVYYRVLA